MKSKIYLEDFERIVKVLYENHLKSEEYMKNLGVVDRNIVNFLYENMYCERLYQERDFLAQELLGDLWEDVMWFLFEMPHNKTSTKEYNVECNGVKYLIDDFNSYMDYARHALQLPIKPTV